MSFKFYLFLIVAFILLALIAVSSGGASISLGDIVKFFTFGEIDETKQLILLQMRLPRLVLGILIGALLATSGVVVQSVFLNPLADPYIIGIASAATFGAVIAYLLGLSDVFYGIFAFLAASGLSLVIFKLAAHTRSISTLLIVGIAVSSFLGAFTSFAVYLIGEDSFRITAWMMGYLGGANWQKIALLLPPLLFCMAYFYAKRHELNIILNGDEEAKSLGLNVEKSKKSLLIGFSVAFMGMIGFVGLIIPHTLRMALHTASNAVLIPASALAGGLFLLFCDVIAKKHPLAGRDPDRRGDFVFRRAIFPIPCV